MQHFWKKEKHTNLICDISQWLAQVTDWNTKCVYKIIAKYEVSQT